MLNASRMTSAIGFLHLSIDFQLLRDLPFKK